MYQSRIEEFKQENTARRVFLSVFVVASLGVILPAKANGGEFSRLSESDPMAKALGYTHISDSKEKTCVNCGLYQGETGDEWGRCSIFPNKMVNAIGWCKSWIASKG